MTLNNKIPTAALLFFLAGFVVLSGCKREKRITGNKYIERDIFVEVITDMHLMDAITNDMKYFRKFNPDDTVDIYSSIFEKYNVNREMYELTIREYSKNPKLLDQVYNDVLMKLQLLQDEVENEKVELDKSSHISGKNN
jgi:hypothetical protein